MLGGGKGEWSPVGVVRVDWAGQKRNETPILSRDDLRCRFCGRAGRLWPGEEGEGSRQYYYGLARQSG